MLIFSTFVCIIILLIWRNYKMAKKSRFFWCFCLIIVAAGFAFSQNRYALVIGNGNYKSREISALTNPVNDATDMAAVMKDLGYNVTLKTNVGLRDMMDSVQDFSMNLKRSSDNEGFFWFAGHGLSVRGIHYMLPVDVDPVNDNIIARGSFSVDDLMEEIGNARNRTNLIVIDACRNTLLPGGSRNVGTRGLSILAADDYRISGNKIVYSTMAGRTAADGLPGSRNSPFAQAFIENIKNPESFDDVFLDIANETMRLTRGDQQPYSMGTFAVKSYMISPPAPAPVAAAPAAPVAAAAPVAPQPSTEPARVSPSPPKEPKAPKTPLDPTTFTLDRKKVMSLGVAPFFGGSPGNKEGSGGLINNGVAFGGSLQLNFYEKYRDYDETFYLPNSFYFSSSLVIQRNRAIHSKDGNFSQDLDGKVNFTSGIFGLGASWKIRLGASQRFILNIGPSFELFIVNGSINQNEIMVPNPSRYTFIYKNDDKGDSEKPLGSDSVLMVSPGFGLHTGISYRLNQLISLDLGLDYKMPFTYDRQIHVAEKVTSTDLYNYHNEIPFRYDKLSINLGVTFWWPR